MLEQILTNSYVQYAIAVVIALLIGKLLKIVIDYKKLLPLIGAIIAIIFKEEEKNISNSEKQSEAVKAVSEGLGREGVNMIAKRFGNVANAVDKIYKVAKPIIKGTSILRVLRNL